MERSLEYPLNPGRTWVREAQAAAAGDGPKVAFTLLLLFILFLYSNIAVVYKSLDAFRPALVIASAAIFMMVVEIAQARRSFHLTWPQGLLLIAFLGVAFVSSFDAMYARLAFNTTSDIAKILLIYIVIENTVTTERRIRVTFATMVLCSMIPAIGILDFYARGILLEGSRAAWRGLFANPNEAAYGLLILLPLAVTVAARSGWLMRIIMGLSIATMLIAIYVTFSRGGLLALLVVAGLIGWKQKSIAIRGLIALALVGGIFLAGLYWNRNRDFEDITKDTTFRQRIATIEAGLLMFEARPLLGVGPGCSVVAYPLYVPKDAHCGCQLQLVVHNSFVQVLGEIGGLGFTVWMLLLGWSLWDARRLQRQSLAPYAAALEVGLWGYVACSLSGGFTYTWWPYIMIGLVAAMKRISATQVFSRTV